MAHRDDSTNDNMCKLATPNNIVLIFDECASGFRETFGGLHKKYGLEIRTNWLPAITSFSFVSENALAYKTLITQEMLEKGYLASNIVFSCTEHSPDTVDGYFEVLNPIFHTIREYEDGKDVKTLLNGSVCQTGFKRLN